MASTRKITLKSSDGVAFDVDEAVAIESQTIKDAIEDFCVIPLPNVTSKILSKVVEYCKKHAEAAAAHSAGTSDCSDGGDEDLKSWDAEFVKVDWPTLYGMIQAANYLNIKSLLDLTCQAVADMLMGATTTSEMCKILNVKSDFTLEEQDEIIWENRWAFEKNGFPPEERAQICRRYHRAFENGHRFTPEEKEFLKKNRWVIKNFTPEQREQQIRWMKQRADQNASNLKK